jgi:replicative DNA helicase
MTAIPRLRDEEIIIATILDDPRLLKSAGGLKPADFNDPDLSLAWKAIISLANSGRPVTIDAITQIVDLDEMRLAEIIGLQAKGYDLLKRSVAQITNVRQAMRAADILKEARDKIEKLVRDPDGDVSQWGSVLADAYRSGLANNGGTASRNAATVRQFVRQAHGADRKSIRTGIKCIDEFLGGRMPSPSLLAFAAQTKVGKTTFATSISYNLEVAGVRHAFITMERSEEEIELMKIARGLGLSGVELRNNPTLLHALDIADDPLSSIERTCQYYHKPGMTLEDIRVEIARLVMVEKIEVVILDYWQLIQGGQREPGKGHLIRTAQGLQQIVTEHSLVGVVTVQLTDYGVSNDEIAMKNAANLFMTLNRDRGSLSGYLQTNANNLGEERDIGSISAPSLFLDPSGPHWRDKLASDPLFSKPY